MSLRKLLATFVALIMFVGSVFAAVDVNTATQAELETIKGIGPAKSAKIVEERKKGAFVDGQDLVKRVPGIGQKSLDKFVAQGLTVGGKGAASPAPAATATPAATPKAETKTDKKK
jgi:competence protein ComEA